ncbi:cytochrome P450 9e2-like [Culex pipiens pallens]|uniref:cytochrome P450 9e2-like n=1 Tax=Culex pipiens pallens TaxID=42434 RepID=UPI001953F1C6|nr:cytochrome P450 9e2-like [Culex pipiens pallens]
MVVALLITLALPALLLYLLYRWSIATYDYFERRAVPFPKPVPLFGNLWPFLAGKTTGVESASAGYWQFPEARFSGFFNFRRPGYLVHDLDLLKRITIKDFDHFVDHSFNVSPEVDPFLGRSLFFSEGLRWRHGRAGLSPAFTGSKMRNMFELLATYSEGAMQRLARGGKVEREAKDLFQRLGNDVMTSISFGIDTDSVQDPDNEFFRNGLRLSITSGIQGLKFFLSTVIPPQVFIFLGLRLTPRDVADFYEDIVTRTIRYREENNVVRPDFIHLLMQARKNELKQEQVDENLASAGFSTVQEFLPAANQENPVKWTDLEITAAAASFFFGGIETTATALCFVLYELSLNPDCQEKLRQEIDTVQEGLGSDRLTYESMQKMKYLDMVITETLRLWPPIALTNRRCTKEYVMENTDGTKVTLEKGDTLQIPVQAIQRDPRYYPNPLRFDPERFSDENRHAINQDAYLPFGAGPRNCIGSRLALMQAKCFLYYLLSYFDVEISAKTDVPMKMKKRTIGVNSRSGFWFHLVPRVK